MKARHSLTTRLTAFFTLASGLVLVGLGTIVAISIDRHFVELDRDALRDKIHLTREVIGKSTSPEDLKMRLDDVLHSHEGLFVSVFRDRATLYTTTDFQMISMPWPRGPTWGLPPGKRRGGNTEGCRHS